MDIDAIATVNDREQARVRDDLDGEWRWIPIEEVPNHLVTLFKSSMGALADAMRPRSCRVHGIMCPADNLCVPAAGVDEYDPPIGALLLDTKYRRDVERVEAAIIESLPPAGDGSTRPAFDEHDVRHVARTAVLALRGAYETRRDEQPLPAQLVNVELHWFGSTCATNPEHGVTSGSNTCDRCLQPGVPLYAAQAMSVVVIR